MTLLKKIQVISTVLLCLMLSSCLAGSGSSNAKILSGKVIRVADGDTVTIMSENKWSTKIRLHAIDAPEMQQAWGSHSRKALKALVYKKTVTVVVKDIDQYDRTVGVIKLDQKNINHEMVKEGHAWVYRRYNREKAMLEFEKSAKQAKKGIWSQAKSKIQAPWEWRQDNF